MGTFILWNIIGCVICAAYAATYNIRDWRLFNPYHAYRSITFLNWFGAIVVSIFYTVFCPLGAVLYWFKKICTVGRK